MHTTVLSKRECEQYLKDPSNKCPFCQYTNIPQLMFYHIKNHFQWAVQHHDFTIVKCNLKCRAKSHFHCCYCSATVITRGNLLKHIASHPSPPTQPQSSSSSVQQAQPQSSSSSVQQAQPQSSSVQRAQPESSSSSVQRAQPESSSVQRAQPESSSVQRAQPESSSVQRAQPESSSVQRAQPQSSSVQRAQPQSSTSSAQRAQPQSSTSSAQRAQPQSSSSSVQQAQPQSFSVLQAQPQSYSVQRAQPQSYSFQWAQPRSSSSSAQRAQPQSSTSSVQRAQPQSSSSSVQQAQPPAVLPKCSIKRTVTCSQCGLTLLAKNLRTHIRRRHTEKENAITPERHFQSQCIDEKIGIFAVEKAFHGQATPIHVIKNTWGPNYRSACEVDQCILNSEFAHNTGILPFECCHVKSLSFCKQVANLNDALAENSLSQLVQQKWFGEARKVQLLKLQQEANNAETPLSFHVTVGGPSTKHFISVFEPTVSYYSRMGRVMVAYDKKKNNWHCPCARPRQSCIHKATAKWHLFQMMPPDERLLIISQSILCLRKLNAKYAEKF
ncbi:uncharacterized protein [Misgurnus anguillicaudatus]|uniref:uncharacterized protein n=1 Tax=Misgurnus anguillicaudatus TaxID=75329 RepID=UPI003CCFDF0B